jgi:hypothetical protein
LEDSRASGGQGDDERGAVDRREALSAAPADREARRQQPEQVENDREDAGGQPGGREAGHEVQKPRRTNSRRRATTPMQVDAGGRKSGLTAMAPTMSIPLR